MERIKSTLGPEDAEDAASGTIAADPGPSGGPVENVCQKCRKLFQVDVRRFAPSAAPFCPPCAKYVSQATYGPFCDHVGREPGQMCPWCKHCPEEES